MSTSDDRRSTSMPAATISTFKSSSSRTVPQTIAHEKSQELLRLLLQKTSSSVNYSNVVTKTEYLDNQINALVRHLIASKTPFDPQKCIDGPLFASVHFIGNTPLWEKIGLSGLVRNVKGQKYTLDSESGSISRGGGGGTFVNYAEIGGNNLYLKASGDFIVVGPFLDEEDLSSPQSTSSVRDTTNPFIGLLSLMFPSEINSNNFAEQQSSLLLTTPYDYSATVTGASLVLFHKLVLNVTIAGTGTVRVLYADENLRIFVSPTDTNVTRGRGEWESEGLIVVQVRVGLIYNDWIDRL